MLWLTLRRLRSKDWRTRLEAVRELSEGAAPEHIDALASALEDAVSSVVLEAAKALTRNRDERGSDKLATLLSRPQLAQEVATLLSNAGWAPKNQVDRVRFAIAKGEFESAAREGAIAVGPLLEVVWNFGHVKSDASKRDMLSIARALALITDPDAVIPFAKALVDRNFSYPLDILVALIKSLGQFRDPRTISCMVWTWAKEGGHFGQELSDAVKEVICAMGSRAVEPLIKELLLPPSSFDNEKYCAERVNNAAELLGLIGDVRAVEPLLQRLDTELKRSAGYSGRVGSIDHALVQIGKPAFDRLVEVLLEDRRPPSLRACVAEHILGNMGDPRALEPLFTALGAESSQLREAAAAALGNMKDSRAVKALCSIVEGDTDISLVLVERATESLGKIGDGHAANPVLSILLRFHEKLGIGHVSENSSIVATVLHTLSLLGDPGIEALSRARDIPGVEVRANWRLANLGSARALRQLLTAARQSEGISEGGYRYAGMTEIVRVLGWILSQDAQNADLEELKELACLAAGEKHYEDDFDHVGTYSSIDCSEVRRLAREELMRRNVSI